MLIKYILKSIQIKLISINVGIACTSEEKHLSISGISVNIFSNFSTNICTKFQCLK